jgi:hypothetical protein
VLTQLTGVDSSAPVNLFGAFCQRQTTDSFCKRSANQIFWQFIRGFTTAGSALECAGSLRDGAADEDAQALGQTFRAPLFHLTLNPVMNLTPAFLLLFMSADERR